MRIYVSYHEEDYPYCIQVIDHLEFHQVRFTRNTVPSSLQSTTDWLEWCDSVIFLATKKSTRSEHCLKEIHCAQQLGKPVIPVILENGMSPLKILDTPYEFTLNNGLEPETVREFLTHLQDIEQQLHQQNHKDSKEKPEITTNELIGEAARAMEEANYTHAVYCLTQILAREDQPKYIDTRQLLNEANIALLQQNQQREMQLEYLQIVKLVQLPATRTVGLKAFKAFQRENPNYDPRNLSTLIEPPPEAEIEQPTFLQYVTDRTRKIPMLEWCEIPAGNVHLTTKEGNKSYFVNTFLMARYPVTNKQYQAFITAPNGYNDPYWWEFSEDAWAWRLQNPEPTESTFGGHDRPRENVNWYEAIAFCRWLSEMTQLEITLPSLIQRRRAIMGDDGREFPWGDTFDQSCCNTRELGLRVTTSVNRYKSGVSQYGVYDLAGNVWEWCLDRAPSEKRDDETVIEKAYVHGGSWMSPYDRCHVDSRSAPPIITAYAAIGFRMVCVGVRQR